MRAVLARKSTPEEASSALKEIQAAYADSEVSRWAAKEIERIKAQGKAK